MNLIKMDMRNNLTEGILHNLLSFQEVQYPKTQDDDLSILNEHKFSLLSTCQKNSRDTVKQMA